MLTPTEDPRLVSHRTPPDPPDSPDHLEDGTTNKHTFKEILMDKLPNLNQSYKGTMGESEESRDTEMGDQEE